MRHPQPQFRDGSNNWIDLESDQVQIMSIIYDAWPKDGKKGRDVVEELGLPLPAADGESSSGSGEEGEPPGQVKNVQQQQAWGGMVLASAAGSLQHPSGKHDGWVRVFLSFHAVFLSFHAVFLSFYAVFLSFSAVFLSFYAVFLSFSAVFLSFHAVFVLKHD